MGDLDAALAHAVEHDELVLHYQPIVDVQTAATEGFEALVRWDRPGLGLVPPTEFIPAAEESDLICEVDTWALNEAAEQLAAWDETASRDLTIAVNISGRHVNTPRFRDDVAGALLRSGIDPGRLVLEITETVPVEDDAIENLHALRRLGVSLSLDDFDTGYSSADQLSRLPVDIVKVDRSYLATGTQVLSESFRRMVRTAHDLGLTVVAEGVEHLDQLALLRAEGVRFAQGYALGRPTVPAELDVP